LRQFQPPFVKQTITKSVLFGMCLTAATPAALAQGTIIFDTYNANTSLGQVFINGGLAPAPYNCVGQLWYSDVSSTSAFSSLSPVVNFSTNMPGYINCGTVTLPSVPPGTTIWYQLRAWFAAAGPDWEWATNWHNVFMNQYGLSSVESAVLGGIDEGGNVFVPQQANDFPSFALIIPEPSAFGLFALGGLFLGWRLGRKHSWVVKCSVTSHGTGIRTSNRHDSNLTTAQGL
jgi:hypothetical protein